ncbi:hypothetical protein [Micromonospora sp. NPDC092111]|uniref:hypothetical protein n=1 Tax=Micromonospora sp. NPDC092111 TaxID=3364289 RepID=UPI003814AB5A
MVDFRAAAFLGGVVLRGGVDSPGGVDSRGGVDFRGGVDSRGAEDRPASSAAAASRSTSGVGAVFRAAAPRRLGDVPVSAGTSPALTGSALGVRRALVVCCRVGPPAAGSAAAPVPLGLPVSVGGWSPTAGVSGVAECS